MLGVCYVGLNEGPEAVLHKGVRFVLEHTVNLPANDLVFLFRFGFGQGQIECVYQGPGELPDAFLAKVVPVLRDAVREELNTGLPQHVQIGD